MSNKRTITFGPPTDSETEPEVIIRRGTTSRPLPNTELVSTPTITTTTTTNIVIDLTAPEPPITVDLTISDISGDDSSTVLLPVSSSSAFVRPNNYRRKAPIQLTAPKPKRPTLVRRIRLEELPPIQSTKFYSSYDLSLENLMWHDRTTTPQLVLANHPRWLRQSATFDKNCVHTQYFHSLFLECPTNNWRPVTRSMGASFSKAMRLAPEGVANCIMLFFELDLEHMNSMVADMSDDESVDDSATLTSEDDAENETLFLFRFWTNAYPGYHRFEPEFDMEFRAGTPAAIDMVDRIIAAYDLETEYMETDIIEVA